MTERIDVWELRKQFPNPVTVSDYKDALYNGDSTAQMYCVGGALCRALSETDDSFPETETLAFFLQDANPSLSESDAEGYAIRITELNDAEQFEAAWSVLGEALRESPSRKEHDDPDPL